MMRTEKVSIKSARGDALSGALDRPIARPRAYALFAHCFSCSKDIRAAREIAGALCAAGIAVLRFDFAGLGASEGDFAETNFSSNIDDLVSAAAFLRGAHEAPTILVGHSLGGAAVIVAASRIPETRAVAAIGAPAEASHVAHQFEGQRAAIAATGEAQVSLAGRPFVIKQQFLDDVGEARVLEAVADLRRPLLLMHAPRDSVVGIDNAARLFGAARHPKSFISLDDADHLLTRAEDARYAATVLAAWAARYLARPSDATSGPPDAPS